MKQNILIIGNGFDLFHQLPTRYKDFMFFASEWDSFYRVYENCDKTKMGSGQICVPLTKAGELTHEALKEFGNHPYLYNREHIQFLNNQLRSNTWIKCFAELCNDELQWIDFEKEIQLVLEDTEEYSIDALLKNKGKVGSAGLPDRLKRIPDIFGSRVSLPYINFGEVEVEEYYADRRFLQKNKEHLIDFMIKELDSLILCLNYYLAEFVSNISVQCYSPDVIDIGEAYILNFNYTTTYQNNYVKSFIKANHAIHGGIANNDIVLGISDNAFDGKTHDYIRFQKYFQRIRNRTGAYYKDWFTAEPDGVGGVKDMHVYIFGHSLGVADFGVLGSFFDRKRVQKITIFYHDESAYENLVINLVKAISKEETVKRIGSGEIELRQLRSAEAMAN